MRGLDPRIHPRIELRFRAMDCRGKPGNDAHAAHRNSYSTVKQQASRESTSSRRDCARALRFSFALRQAEGAGKTGRRLAPAVSCANAQKENAHEHTGVAETSRPSLRNGFTALLRALPGERLSCHRRPREVLLLTNLTPAPRRQDHTASPSASTAFVSQTRVIDKLTADEFVYTNPNVAGGRGSASNSYRRGEEGIGGEGGG